MSKRHCLIDPQTPKSQETISTDYDKCVICQSDTSESLQWPSQSKGKDVTPEQVYSAFAENILRFHELQQLPVQIDLKPLDDGGGISITLLKNHTAKWHKSCHVKFNTTKLKRAEKRKNDDIEPGPSVTKKFTRRIGQSEVKETAPRTCFFCDKEASESDPLREASTFRLDSRVRMCVVELQDENLLAKLSVGDLVAQEAKYHPRCLVLLYKAASSLNKSNQLDTDTISHGIALAELLTYIDDARIDEDVAPIFKFAELVKLYSSRLEQLGVDTESRIHSTKLKERILNQFPDLKAYKEGRDVLLAFDKGLEPALKKACQNDDCDDDAICLARAANIVRRDMVDMQMNFNGSFSSDCQVKSVPQSLVALVSMIQDGSNIRSQSGNGVTQTTLSIAQLLLFNSSKRRRTGSKAVYHNNTKEPPLPIYLGLTVHARTRKRELIETLFDLGLSVSYDRVMEISTSLGNSISEMYHRDQVVCPPNLRNGLFTVAAIDNINHYTSSTTATDSFHGTGISLFQCLSSENTGLTRLRENVYIENQSSSKSLQELPEFYTVIHPVNVPKKDATVPQVNGTVISDGHTIQQELQKENGWLQTVDEKYLEDVDDNTNLSWAAYHATNQEDNEVIPAIAALLPLFPDDSKSVAMIRHSMDVIRQSVQHVNPHQIPVVTLDQHLFALAKQIQWYWPDRYGEDKFVVLGGLHIEMASLKLIGNWLEDSGWVEALVQANVASAGMAESFLKSSHVTRTRHAHQVTAASLYILLKMAYAQYQESLEPHGQAKPLEEWCEQQKRLIPQFQFWWIVLQLELLMLTFVRSLRTGNFTLYVESLTKLAPWFFSLDHTNYTRWLPVHIRDMVSLRRRHPEIASEFDKGNFALHKTKRPFSSIAIDQAHEQNNATIKSEGGAIGLKQNGIRNIY